MSWAKAIVIAMAFVMACILGVALFIYALLALPPVGMLAAVLVLVAIYAVGAIAHSTKAKASRD